MILCLPRPKPAHRYQSFVIRLADGGRKRRNGVMAALAKQDIQTRPGTHVVPILGYYRKKYGFEGRNYPNAVLAEDTTITLPLFPGMTTTDVARVVETLSAALGEVSR